MVRTVKPDTSSNLSTMDNVFLAISWALQSLIVLAVMVYTTCVVVLLAAKGNPSFAYMSWILFLILTLITLSLTGVEIYRYLSSKGLNPKAYLLYQQVKTALSLVVWTVIVIRSFIEPGEHSLRTDMLVKMGIVCQIPFIIPLIYASWNAIGAGHTGEEDLSGQDESAPLLRS